MTEKMNDNLQKNYISGVFEILKICKELSNFDFNSTIRKKYIGCCNCLEKWS